MNFDNTHLSIDSAYERGLIHKDYLAHCLRWSFLATRFLHRTDPVWALKCGGDPKYHRFYHARILDFGCGIDMPLFKILCTNKKTKLPRYMAVDINELAVPEKLSLIHI